MFISNGSSIEKSVDNNRTSRNSIFNLLSLIHISYKCFYIYEWRALFVFVYMDSNSSIHLFSPFIKFDHTIKHFQRQQQQRRRNEAVSVRTTVNKLIHTRSHHIYKLKRCSFDVLNTYKNMFATCVANLVRF